MNLTPLRYNISSWAQATECLSNNSPDLSISVASITDRALNGQIISVQHALYGTLFAAATSGDGIIVSDNDGFGNPITWMSTEEILNQLARYGFYITFKVQAHLAGEVLTCLMKFYNIGFTHISRIKVKLENETENSFIAVVTFDGASLPDWLSYPCEIKYKDYLKALADGYAFNVSAISQFLNLDWSWLTFVANIEDVINENA